MSAPRQLKLVEQWAKKWGYAFTVRNAPTDFVLSDDHSVATIGLVFTEEERVALFLYVRTRSWDFIGERTDLNDALSLLYATFIRLFFARTSCGLWDVLNPVTFEKSEIYGRYVTIDQPQGSTFELNDHGIAQIESVIASIRFLERMLPSILDWTVQGDQQIQEDYGFRGPEVIGWAQTICDVLRIPLDDDLNTYNWRKNPSWMYFRSARRGLSAYHAPRLAEALRLAVKQRSAWRTLPGINGKLYVSDDASNIISSRNMTLARKVLRGLSASRTVTDTVFVPLENFFVAANRSTVLFVNRDCGRKRFEKERERIRKRHQDELEVLFPPSSLVWHERPDYEQFELLILELLRREAGVHWVRKVGVSNEPDGKRDLIAEWTTPPVAGQMLSEDTPPLTTKRVVIQCKSSTRSVGKDKVQDIYDTVKRHDSQGYFLAVSSYTARSLTEALEKMRNDGEYWVDWWTRNEIEEKLKANPDLVVKYSGVVRVGD